MSYTSPSATEVKTRFPEFVDVSDARVDAFVAEAARRVDSSWIEDDASVAMTYLAAHMMAAEGLLRGAGLAAIGDVSGPITSESLGDASVSYGSWGGGDVSAFEAELRSTPYGRLYDNLRRRNVGGPVII